MLSLNGLIEIFVVLAESQPPILFSSVDQTVDPWCGSPSSIFVMMPFLTISSNIILKADWHASWRIDYWWNIGI